MVLTFVSQAKSFILFYVLISRFVLASWIESYLVIQALSTERIVDCKMKLLWPRTVLMSTADPL